MQPKLQSMLGWCGLIAAALVAIQACGDSPEKRVAEVGASGAGDAGSPEGGMVDASSGAPSTGGVGANGGSGTAGEPSTGGTGTPDAGGAGADAGANGGAAGTASGAVTCHIAWTGAATGEADCSHVEVCHQNFLSLGVVQLAAAAAPLTSIQLIYSPAQLSLGQFTAVGLDMVNSNVQTSGANVRYAPKYDADNHLSDGTSMMGTLTDLRFSTDVNDPCSGSAHGSFDAVLPDSANSANKLALHVEF